MRAYVLTAARSQLPQVRPRPGALSLSSASQPFAPHAVHARAQLVEAPFDAWKVERLHCGHRFPFGIPTGYA